MQRERAKRLTRATALAIGLAIGIGTIQTVEAQFVPSGFPRTGGPLWWMPENDNTWSRFHDVWHNSQNVENAQFYPRRGRGAATSFPEDTWVVTRLNGYTNQALANSACDYQNGTEIFNVGPPLTDGEYPAQGARDIRKPSDRSGGLGGLQMSLHIGEWWQGLFFEPMSGSSYVWPNWWNPIQFGSFSVSTKNNNGTEIPAFGPQGPWDGFRPRPGMMLTGGGSETQGCIGQALVMMHGTENGRGVYPEGPKDADGSPCYSQARLFVLRANTEARCEPNLRERYDMTEDFWEWFEGYEFDLASLMPGIGGPFPPLIPEGYEGPYPLMRRGEFALFTVGEFAAPDQAIRPIPWDTPQFQVGTGTDRRNELTHFVDDATRPRPFGGETMTLRNNTGDDFGVEECLEIAPAGWDAVTGTFNPMCPDAWTSDTRFTGIVNHENNGTGQTVRPIEVGRHDNREAIGTATIRRLGGPEPDWTTAGYGWFEHKKATIGCLMLRATFNDQLRWDAMEAAEELRNVSNELARAWGRECDRPDWFCSPQGADLMDRFIKANQQRFGWALISTWRFRELASLRRALPMYDEITPNGDLIAQGRGPLSLENNRCYTGEIGEPGYNERLASTSSTEVGADEWMNPAWSGKTYWGSDMEQEAWWESAGGDHDYHYFAEVRGAITNSVAADAANRTGVAEPFPIDLDHEYGGDGVRRGGYTFREFACPTADHQGYYGAGITHMGPQTVSHRDAPAGEGWKNPDSLIDPNNNERRYPTGTPCIDEATSAVSQVTGDPLARYYNVRGSDPATLQPGEKRCYETRRPTPDEITNRGIDPDTWLPVSGEPGQWSNPGHSSGLDSKYYLEYSGDAAMGTQPAGDPKMRPTSYSFNDSSAVMALVLGEPVMDLWLGMPSLDLEREDMSAIYMREPSARLSSSESYEGVAPGFCTQGGCGPPPMDWGRVDYEGPIRFFGGGGVGGKGGCVLGLPRGPLDTIDIMEPGGGTDVMSPDQTIFCMLPTDAAIAKPSGTCPRPGVG